MDPETYKWLSEALEEYTYDEVILFMILLIKNI